MSLEAEIKESIEKNLPAMIGKKLQDRLALVDQLEEKIRIKENENNTLKSENAKLVSQNNELMVRDSEVKKYDEEIKKREKIVIDVEHKLEIAALKLEFANKGAETVERLFNTVFRNTVVRNKVLDQLPTDIYTTQYNQSKQCNESVKSGTWLQPVNKDEFRTEE